MHYYPLHHSSDPRNDAILALPYNIVKIAPLPSGRGKYTPMGYIMLASGCIMLPSALRPPGRSAILLQYVENSATNHVETTIALQFKFRPKESIPDLL